MGLSFGGGITIGGGITFTPPPDPDDIPSSTYWDETVLSMGTNSTTEYDNYQWDDKSSNNATVSKFGTPYQSAFNPYLDNYSFYFDNTNDDMRLNETVTVMGTTDDFTVEWWVNVTGGPSNYGTLFQMGSGQLAWKWDTSPEGFNFVNVGTNPGFNYGISTGGITKNKWTHMAITRSSGTVYFFIDGSEVHNRGAGADETAYNWGDIDLGSKNNQDFFGGKTYLSNFRIVVGTALYTDGYTVPTEKLTAVTGTKILLNGRNYVESVNGYKFTPYNQMQVVSYNPFGQSREGGTGNNYGSAYFDGSGDYLVVGSATDLGTGDFTIQGWFYDQRAVITERQLISNRGQGGSIYLGLVSTDELYPYIGGDYRTTGADFGMNCWVHFAISRESGTLRTYVDGVKYREDSVTGDIFGTNGWEIGGGDVGQFKGWISDLKVSTTAEYTGTTYTVPTEPVGATNADLYLPFDNAGIFDKSNTTTNIILNGQTETSTAETKYASSNMFFDGNGDFIDAVVPGGLGLGDFTLEFWVYLTSDSPYGGVIINTLSNGGGYSATDGVMMKNQDVLQVRLANTLYNLTALSHSTWYHIAITRASGTMNVWVDGSSALSVTRTEAMTSENFMIGGSDANYVAYSKGYIENFQVLQGVAKYTASFTPPTQEQGRTYQATS